VFVPYIFSGAAVPLHLTAEYRSYWQLEANPENARALASYDYLLLIYQPQFDVPSGLALQEVARGKTYTLYHVEHRQ